MAKSIPHSINLIPKRDTDSPIVQRLKKILPLTAVASLLLFVLLFFSSLLYTNAHLAEFNRLKKEVEILEGRIASQKTTEGIYTLTAMVLNVLKQTMSGTKQFSPLIGEVASFEKSGIRISSLLADKKGNVSVAVSASSSAILSAFVETLIKQENEKKTFTNLFAQGTIRDRKGKYNVTISMKADPSLLQ